MKPYTLLESLLNEIELHLTENTGELPTIDELALFLSISAVHLQRLFKFAFGQPLAGYIRSRRLSASLTDLLTGDLNILDIAVKYGFEYEQSYIRSFKREFGFTPGELRKTEPIVKITPPLQLFASNRLDDGVFFGPEIVMVPGFQVVGKRYQIPFDDSVAKAPLAARDFIDNELEKIHNIKTPDLYIGLTRIPENTDYSWYLPAVLVKNLDDVPAGLTGDSFAPSLCVRFHYIGQHQYYDINADIARGMYDAIVAFVHDESENYDCCHNKLYFEKINISAHDGTYCQMEWFTPVFKKMIKNVN